MIRWSIWWRNYEEEIQNEQLTEDEVEELDNNQKKDDTISEKSAKERSDEETAKPRRGLYRAKAKHSEYDFMSSINKRSK